MDKAMDEGKALFGSVDIEEMQQRASDVEAFLKGLANKHRLLILCQLAMGEKSVTELIDTVGVSQTSMSQHLKKLREEGIVDYRRDHRTLYYSIVDDKTMRIMGTLCEMYCGV